MQASEQTLTSVGRRVLESMAFAVVSADPVDEERDATVCEGTVRFSGPFRGSASMRMPEPVLAELGSSMLGLGEGSECSEQQRRDVLGELTNVFCGNLLEALAGSSCTFDLETPEVQSEVHLPCSKVPKAQRTSVRVSVENGWVELSLVSADLGADGTA